MASRSYGQRVLLPLAGTQPHMIYSYGPIYGPTQVRLYRAMALCIVYLMPVYSNGERVLLPLAGTQPHIIDSYGRI